MGFPVVQMGKNPPANAGDLGSIPGLGRSPGEGNGNPLQYSCLENSTDRGACQATVHGAAESDRKEHARKEGRIRAGEAVDWYSLTTHERTSHTLSSGLSLFSVECDCLLHPEGEL